MAGNPPAEDVGCKPLKYNTRVILSNAKNLGERGQPRFFALLRMTEMSFFELVFPPRRDGPRAIKQSGLNVRTNEQNDGKDLNDSLPTMRECRAEGQTDTSLGRKAQVPAEKQEKG